MKAGEASGAAKTAAIGLESILEQKDKAPVKVPKQQSKPKVNLFDDLPGGSIDDDDSQFAKFKQKDIFGLESGSKTKPI